MLLVACLRPLHGRSLLLAIEKIAKLPILELEMENRHFGHEHVFDCLNAVQLTSGTRT